LLKFTSGKDGGSITETIHSYDAEGRPLSITSSNAPDNPITFRYDERGRKTKLQISRPEDYRPNVAVAGSPFQAADMRAPNLLGGGSATTKYDELDRPIEVQVRDSQEEPISRASRIYDEQGRVAEEQQILASPEAIVPAELRAKILKESGISLEELRAQLTKVMGGQAGPHSEAYSYDEAGRIERKLRRVFNEEETIQTTFNEQGDQAIEITRRKQIGEIEQSAAPVRQSEYSEVRYEYEYDDHNNWTRQVVSYRHSLDGEFQFSSERRRTISYY
jgi:YD repeat-containing protein